MQSTSISEVNNDYTQKVNQKFQIWKAVSQIIDTPNQVELKPQVNQANLPSDAELKVLAKYLWNINSTIQQIECNLKEIETLNTEDKEKAYEALNQFIKSRFYNPFSKRLHGLIYGTLSYGVAAIIITSIVTCCPDVSPYIVLALPIALLLGVGFGIYQANEKVKELSEDTQRLLFN